MDAGFVVVALALSPLASAAAIPKFSDFPVAPLLEGRPAKPILRTPFQKRFATQILEQATAPANFAGHYKVAEWGCGRSCVSIAIIDLVSGAVYNGPFRVLSYAEPYVYEGGSDEAEYNANSRLFIARGCPQETHCGTYYYEWKAERFRQLRFVPHGPLAE